MSCSKETRVGASGVGVEVLKRQVEGGVIHPRRAILP